MRPPLQIGIRYTRRCRKDLPLHSIGENPDDANSRGLFCVAKPDRPLVLNVKARRRMLIAGKYVVRGHKNVFYFPLRLMWPGEEVALQRSYDQHLTSTSVVGCHPLNGIVARPTFDWNAWTVELEAILIPRTCRITDIEQLAELARKWSGQKSHIFFCEPQVLLYWGLVKRSPVNCGLPQSCSC